MKRVNKLLICVLGVAAFVVLLSVFFFDSNPKKLISDDYLKKEIKPGEMVSFSTASGLQEGFVCMMCPYDFLIFDSELPEAEKINDYLKSHHIRIKEGEWGIVYLLGDKIEISRYPVYHIPVLYRNDFVHKRDVPISFEITQCVPMQNAMLYKTSSSYLVFGRTK